MLEDTYMVKHLPHSDCMNENSSGNIVDGKMNTPDEGVIVNGESRSANEGHGKAIPHQLYDPLLLCEEEQEGSNVATNRNNGRKMYKVDDSSGNSSNETGWIAKMKRFFSFNPFAQR